ncbi:MAG: VWA domain-containing protein [Gammaproteobacteria bacterium]
MGKPKRALLAFNLSFLDIMSCGFGATVLLFLIIKHQIDTTPIPEPRKDPASEVMLLEEEVLRGEKNLALLRNTIEAIEEQVETAQGLADKVMEESREVAALTETLEPDATAMELDALKNRILKLEQQRETVQDDINKTGEQAVRVVGEGNRQYITGLKLNGKRSLILLDISASMLDRTVVNILRFRNMRDERKRLTEKWQQTIRTVEWLLANLPVDSQYQLYLFNTATAAALNETGGRWLHVKDQVTVKKTVDHLRIIVPEKGTNLEKAFLAAQRLRPAPDNIYLITDGLPTQGSKTFGGTTISPKQRLILFQRAIEQSPARVPVNVLLAPMEGDVQASFAFWQLIRKTNGSFISPRSDWP